ncbi:MAG: hypothetical protein EHM64_03835 [Ignavibacteriae bacterium]|nr:MAG: hypothetical protein EHM64_03835 [Ignavibacteriota bacterium]
MKSKEKKEYPWINPIGGYGDMLMLSGVLKLVVDKNPENRFNLVRRTNYGTFLDNHPAIASIGYPSKNARMVRSDYWSMEPLGPGSQRAFQILARSFGLQTPVEETLYVPFKIPDDPLLWKILPENQKTVLIAPASDSPRKMMNPIIWDQVTEMLKGDGIFVVQAGRTRDIHIRPAYSLLGLTTPKQLLGLLGKVHGVVTVDNFIMHASHYTGTPTIVLWGATNNQVYGYQGQTHIQMPKACGLSEFDDCMAPSKNKETFLYPTPCPHKERHCLDQMRPDVLYNSIRLLLGN